MTDELKTDENKRDWSRRFIDAHEKMKWVDSIQVIPADKSGHGTRIFPDGTRESFTVDRAENYTE